MTQQNEIQSSTQNAISLDTSLMFPRVMRSFFVSTFEQLQSMNPQPFLQARAGYTNVKPFRSIAEILTYLRVERTSETYRNRETLVLSLITECRRVPSAFWSHALIMVFAPMLARLRCRLRHGPYESEDIDQMLIEIFLGVIFGCHLEKLHPHTIIAIRRACTREIFQRFQIELEDQQAQQHLSDCVTRLQFNPFDEMSDDADMRDMMMAEFSRTIKRHLKNKQHAEIITQTLIQGQSLRSYVRNILHQQALKYPLDVLYQSVKRRRNREIAHLRIKLSKRIQLIRENQECADDSLP